MSHDEKLSLINIKDGAVVEMFDIALGIVFANIRDINTTLDAREIILKMKVIPRDEERSLAEVTFKVDKKLAGQGVKKASIDIKMDSKGRVYGRERNKQLGLQLEINNVSSFQKGEQE